MLTEIWRKIYIYKHKNPVNIS